MRIAEIGKLSTIIEAKWVSVTELKSWWNAFCVAVGRCAQFIGWKVDSMENFLRWESSLSMAGRDCSLDIQPAFREYKEVWKSPSTSRTNVWSDMRAGCEKIEGSSLLDVGDPITRLPKMCFRQADRNCQEARAQVRRVEKSSERWSMAISISS